MKKPAPKNIFFRIEERGKPDKYNNRWKFLIDKTGSIWGICATYSSVRYTIKMLKKKYGHELKKRGTFTLEELKRKKNVRVFEKKEKQKNS